jgi:hypothetical protein
MTITENNYLDLLGEILPSLNAFGLNNEANKTSSISSKDFIPIKASLRSLDNISSIKVAK